MSLWRSLSVLLHPPAKCLVCGSDYCNNAFPFCEDCRSAYTELIVKGCVDCGKSTYNCNCVNVPHCIRVYWLFSYSGETARAIIYSLKMNSVYSDFNYFAHRLQEQIQYISGDNFGFDCITYVPRSKEGIERYGYDQAMLLARRLSKLFEIPCKPLIAHTGISGQQKRLNREFRGTAAKTRFCPNTSELICDSFPYKKVLLVDDVVTTGATMGECARILKSHGVSRVFGAFIAHTPYVKPK